MYEVPNLKNTQSRKKSNYNGTIIENFTLNLYYTGDIQASNTALYLD